MQLEALRVLHLRKPPVGSLGSCLLSQQIPGFYLETCQRWICISTRDSLVRFSTFLEGLDVFEGRAAYQFLLRFATGLESEVVGETDVFGQFKEGWRRIQFSGTPLSFELNPWMQRILEDTKEIRTRYLQNLGGASYGSLVRKVLREQRQEGPMGPTLLIGAGQIARAVAPYLLDGALWVWNRDSSRIESLCSEVAKKNPNAQVSQVSPLEEAEAWKNAAQIVLCIPLSASKDSERVSWLQQNSLNPRVIHLGGMREQCENWKVLPRFFALDDLFQVQKSLGNIRSVQISQAGKACEERALLRSLGASLSIPHGWEDLACFA